jgi:uncharacterized protein YcbK (DUF882 family)
VQVSVARPVSVNSARARISYCCSLATLLLIIGCDGLQNATADGETRTISLHHIHLNEDTTVTYKRNGRYDEEALKKINMALRDWRSGEPTKMDPHLIDIVWEAHREVGSKGPIHVIGGYRAPGTNEMLRRRSSGVARHSLHMSGKAMDFFIPDVKLEDLRNAGLRLQRGGVGFYPSSGSAFVHMDTGRVRHWPRIPETQLARVMSTARQVQLAAATASDRPGTVENAVVRRQPAVLAKMVRPARGTDQDEDDEIAAAPAPARVPSPTPRPEISRTVVAAATPAVPMPQARPSQAAASFELASATSAPARPAQASSLMGRASGTVSANDVITERGYWQGLPELAEGPPRPPAPIPVQRPADVVIASADPVTTGSLAPWPLPDRSERGPTGRALAYAPAAEPVAPARATPMGSGNARATTPAAPTDTTVALKRSGSQPSLLSATPAPAPMARVQTAKAIEQRDDPWLRAMIITPSAQGFMSTSLLGAPDFRNLSPYLRKPHQSVMMTFSDDPYLGMSEDKFSGAAVIFVSTVTFQGRTAALR